MDQHVYIDPCSLPTVRRVGGAFVEITNDVQNVARDLQAIDPRFRLRFDMRPEAFVVELHTPQPDGSVEEHFVGAYKTLDQRMVADARNYTRPDYDLASELERLEDQRERERDHQTHERLGDVADRLGHALRTDLGEKRNF